MDFKNIEKKYRPIPFWSWNERLDTSETERQIREMNERGLGGYFMHARGGLQTEYMSKEWFDNISAGIELGNKLGMQPWAYDENGWPSGFGDGLVNELGEKYQQKYLRIEKGKQQTNATIANVNGYHIFYEINPFYVDLLDADVTKEFIDKIYLLYFEKYGADFKGFFTDEPQLSRNGIPWSLVLPDEYKKAYGDDLLPRLPELFYEVGDYQTTRLKFWKLVTNLFVNNFTKQIYDWTSERGLQLTGHMVCEETMGEQLACNGAVMPHYEYFHIPGMDWLGRTLAYKATPLQVSSVAQQLGRKQVMSETFGLAGWNINFEQLKRIYEWQMVRGINLLCPHLQAYSLRGIRKRDYPPSVYEQQPWWNDYNIFVDAMSRIGKILSEGKVEFDTLLIHPQSTAWVMFNNADNGKLEEYDNAFRECIDTLEKKHILFHLGDEIIMEKHAKVDGNTLVIGTQRYTNVILPPHIVLFDSTRELLDKFSANGGVVTTSGEIPANDTIDNENITYTKRKFADFDVHYFVNSTDDKQVANITKVAKVLDIKSGELLSFGGGKKFEPFESLVIIDDGTEFAETNCDINQAPLDLGGEWEIEECDYNALTLDRCDYYFDGELIEKNGYVLNIQQRACDLERSVNVKMKYNFAVKDIPAICFLLCETPEIFKISINGNVVNNQTGEYHYDYSFKKIDIAGKLRTGDNEIILEVEFKQSAEVYKNIADAKIFESVKNKLTYDMEIENIYIVGDFGVETSGEYCSAENDALCYHGDFVITERKKTVELSDIERQGFPFFAGSITLRKVIELEDANYSVKFYELNCVVAKIEVNGNPQTIVWRPYFADVSKFLRKGKNEVKITLTNSLRNLLGPHHEGVESFGVMPMSFMKESDLWGATTNWNDGYCFVKFGIK